MLTNIRKENGVIKAAYEGIEYIFSTITELLIAVSTLKNIISYNNYLNDLDKINMVY